MSCGCAFSEGTLANSASRHRELVCDAFDTKNLITRSNLRRFRAVRVSCYHNGKNEAQAAKILRTISRTAGEIAEPGGQPTRLFPRIRGRRRGARLQRIFSHLRPLRKEVRTETREVHLRRPALGRTLCEADDAHV